MGQRHQIYLALPPCSLCEGTGKRLDGMEVRGGCNGCGGKGWMHGKVVGVHHQWLYGHTAIKQLGRALSFIKADMAMKSSGKLSSGYVDPVGILKGIYSCIPEEGYFHEVHPLEDECEDPRRGDNNDGITILDARGIRDGRLGYAMMALEDGNEGKEKLPEFVPVDACAYVNSYYPREKRDMNLVKLIAPLLKNVLDSGATLLSAKDVGEIFPSLAGVVK